MDAFRDLNFAVQGFRDAVAHYFNLGLRETQAAAHLVTHGQLNAGQLGRLLDLAPGTITHLLGRLERAGLATVGPDPTDRRRQLIKPSNRAYTVIEHVRTWLDSCLDSFDNTEIALSVVTDVTKNLRTELQSVNASLQSASNPGTRTRRSHKQPLPSPRTNSSD